MDIFSKAAVAGFGLAALAAAPAAAQTINAFTTQNVIQALTNIGVQGAQAGKINGPQGEGDVVRFEANGLKHVAALEVCNTGASGCLGLNLITVWDGVPGVNVNILNEFNMSYSFGKAIGVDQNMAVSRYVISDGGISLKNLQENISNHADLAVGFVEFYRNAAGASTVSLDAAAARSKPLQISAPPGLEGLAPLLDPNDFKAPPSMSATPSAAHVSPR
jgi:hypothetical protein